MYMKNRIECDGRRYLGQLYAENRIQWGLLRQGKDPSPQPVTCREKSCKNCNNAAPFKQFMLKLCKKCNNFRANLL